MAVSCQTQGYTHLVRNIVAQVAAEESEVVMVPCEERGVLPHLDQSEVSTVVT